MTTKPTTNPSAPSVTLDEQIAWAEARFTAQQLHVHAGYTGGDNLSLLATYAAILATLRRVRELEADEEYGPLAFIAASLNAKNSTIPRWWCLSAEYRAKSLVLAKEVISKWATKEQATAIRYSRVDAAIDAARGSEG